MLFLILATLYNFISENVRSLFVHRLDKFEKFPNVVNKLKIFYTDEVQNAKVQLDENNRHSLHL